MYTSGIYCITNIDNNKTYYGSAKNLSKRFNRHKEQLRKNAHGNRYLQTSYNKHGLDVFTFKILLYCSPEDLLFYEQRFLDKYFGLNCYNMRPTAGSSLGYKTSEETKAKLSKAMSGREISDDFRAKMSSIRKGQTLGPKSDEAKQNQSLSLKGKPWSDARRKAHKVVND